MDIPGVRVDWRAKGFWQPEGAADLTARPSLFGGGFSWPVLTVRRSAVAANIATMASFAARHGLALAPHAKTSMAPTIIAAQLAAGAWGCTVATAHQALVLRRLGVPRILIANPVLDPVALRWLAGEVDRGFDAYLQVDSVTGVAAAAAAAAAVRPGAVPVPVLVELGHDGGRTGARGLAGVRAVARAAAAAPGLRLAGVTAYEGGVAGGAAGVAAFLDDLVAAAHAVEVDAPVVSAGGSAWFDVVAERLAAAPAGATKVLRSGAYVTHDDGYYRTHTPFTRIDGELRPALAIWAQVLSVPEPGLAIVGMGKRDAPFDEGLPVPQLVRAAGGTRPAVGLTVTRLQDQHCYLRGDGLVPGDLIRFGISHPCTAFDKWRAIPVVEDDDTVTDVLDTYF